MADWSGLVAHSGAVVFGGAAAFPWEIPSGTAAATCCFWHCQKRQRQSFSIKHVCFICPSRPALYGPELLCNSALAGCSPCLLTVHLKHEFPVRLGGTCLPALSFSQVVTGLAFLLLLWNLLRLVQNAAFKDIVNCQCHAWNPWVTVHWPWEN